MTIDERFLDDYLKLVLGGLDILQTAFEDHIKTLKSQGSWSGPGAFGNAEKTLALVLAKIKAVSQAPLAFKDQAKDMLETLDVMYRSVRIDIGGFELVAKTERIRIPYDAEITSDKIRGKGVKEAGIYLVVLNAARPYFQDANLSGVRIFRPAEDENELRTLGIPLGYIHPHVSPTGGGIVCWSGYKGVMEQSLASCDFLSLLLLVYHFLSSVNLNSMHERETFYKLPEVRPVSSKSKLSALSGPNPSGDGRTREEQSV